MVSVSSSDKIYYKGKYWNLDDPFKPRGLTTDLIIENLFKEARYKDETSMTWKVVGFVADSINIASVIVIAIAILSKIIFGSFGGLFGIAADPILESTVGYCLLPFFFLECLS